MVEDTPSPQATKTDLEQQTSTPGALSEPIQGSTNVAYAMQPRMQASEPISAAPKE